MRTVPTKSEISAKETLKYIPYLNYKNFTNSDKPDLQNYKDNIGIEVVYPQIEEEVRNKKLFKKYRFDAIKDNILTSKSYKDTVFNPVMGLTNNSKTNKIIVKNINKKLKKLKGYKNFKENYLFIFSDNCIEKDVKYFVKKIRKVEKYKRKRFDKYFIGVPGQAIYDINIKDNSVNKYDIN